MKFVFFFVALVASAAARAEPMQIGEPITVTISATVNNSLFFEVEKKDGEYVGYVNGEQVEVAVTQDDEGNLIVEGQE